MPSPIDHRGNSTTSKRDDDENERRVVMTHFVYKARSILSAIQTQSHAFAYLEAPSHRGLPDEKRRLFRKRGAY
ncbi:hypothetical protein Y032_0001g391 [Ancylostoma ceylanicum]|uniref:Uncharacterized protein n=1 Tax=Ancylostoma ceylanicum TaxID=53326 RepID=A0A016W474_9BILA|nr:hypothetical protein Y032_0001g391 [Ancylostoma ceylanicum]